MSFESVDEQVFGLRFKNAINQSFGHAYEPNLDDVLSDHETELHSEINVIKSKKDEDINEAVESESVNYESEIAGETEKLRPIIKEAFAHWDENSEGKMKIEHIGSLLRALDMNPTEADVSDFEAQLKPKDGYISIENVEEKLIKALIVGNYQKLSECDLVKAFEAFDKLKTGYVDKEVFNCILSEMGEPLSSKNTKKILKTMKTDKSGRIAYKDFIQNVLCR